MTDLPRLKPDPIPAIHPLPEYLAEGQLKAWYEDVKAVFQVPWMGVVTMAYAHYPRFFAALWQDGRALAASRDFVEACRANRAFAETAVARLGPAPITGRLAEVGYAPREIAAIGEVLEIFSHGNQPYLLLATLARHLLEGGEMAGGSGPAPAYEGRHAPETAQPVVLMEAHHADPPTRAIYDEVKATLGLPFVNTDYRALARWPSYWAMAWGDLGGVAGSPAHEAICQGLHARAAAQAGETLPNPGGLSGAALRAAAAEDASLEEVRDVCRLFQWLLPGLVTNIAYLRAQLAPAPV